MRLRLLSGKALRIRAWEEGSVVFSPISGETYFLDPVATEGARCIPCEWQEDAAYRMAFAARLGVVDDEVLSRYVQQLMAQFQASGLMEVETP